MTRATINWLANISCYGYYITLDPWLGCASCKGYSTLGYGLRQDILRIMGGGRDLMPDLVEL
jgi:hypothetical protein